MNEELDEMIERFHEKYAYLEIDEKPCDVIKYIDTFNEKYEQLIVRFQSDI